MPVNQTPTLLTSIGQIITDLSGRPKETVSMSEEQKIKNRWLSSTFNHLYFAIQELDRITSKYKKLYNSDQVGFGGEYLAKQYPKIIYHTNVFLETIYIISNALDKVFHIKIFKKYREIEYAHKLRNLFIVHPIGLGLSFRRGVPVVLHSGEILLAKISFSYSLEKENNLYLKILKEKRHVSRLNYLAYVETKKDDIKNEILEIKELGKFWEKTKHKNEILALGVLSVDQLKLASEFSNLYRNEIIPILATG